MDGSGIIERSKQSSSIRNAFLRGFGFGRVKRSPLCSNSLNIWTADAKERSIPARGILQQIRATSTLNEANDCALDDLSDNSLEISPPLRPHSIRSTMLTCLVRTAYRVGLWVIPCNRQVSQLSEWMRACTVWCVLFLHCLETRMCQHSCAAGCIYQPVYFPMFQHSYVKVS